MTSSVPTFRLETQLIHKGRGEERVRGAVAFPIFQSSTFENSCEAADSYHNVQYIRLNNTPNHEVLHAKLAAIEGTEDALVAASGMAAITAVLLAFLRKGDRVLAQNVLYGGTYTFMAHELPKMGIEVSFFDATQYSSSWDTLVTPTTKLVYTEGLTNPLLQVADHEAVVSFARKHKLLTVIDNTLLTPVFWQPFKFGYDIVVHSATKYLNGHSDIVAGVVAGRKSHVTTVRHTLNHLGGSLDPHACFLLNRGLQTLALRVKQQSASALILAERLEKHPLVRMVNFAGLPSHPSYSRSSKLFSGFGALLSFEVKLTEEDARKRLPLFLKQLKLFAVAPSLGGGESLITVPVFTSHAGMTAEERRKSGISNALVRVSVGLEHPDDLWDDLRAALRVLEPSSKL